MGKIFYIMGKSASGKDHIFSNILKEKELKLEKILIYTTRPIRAGEQDGREYYFVNEALMEELESQGKVIERRSYQTVHGIWNYFTADNGQMNLETSDYIGIGTLESYEKLKKYYGDEVVYPIYIEVEDGCRLMRALQREQEQENPKYAEMCRRFLADSEDFSEEKLKNAGISRKFYNNGKMEECIDEIITFVKKQQKE